MRKIVRPILDSKMIDENAAKKIASFHSDVVAEVQNAVAQNKVVVVGMSVNPLVGKARRILAANGIDHKYLMYGGYTSQWKKRLAIKLWSGWPTFPQVFVEGRLIGGFTDLKKQIDEGKLKNLQG